MNDKQLNKMINHIDTLYDLNIHHIIKKVKPEEKNYLASLISSESSIYFISSGNREIKSSVKFLKTTIKQLYENYELLKEENDILKEQIRNQDNNKLCKKTCQDNFRKAQKYIEHFLKVRKTILKIETFDKTKINQIKIKKPTYENVQDILDELEEYQNQDLLNFLTIKEQKQNILYDYLRIYLKDEFSITKQDIKMILCYITNQTLINATFWDKKIIDEFKTKTKTNIVNMNIIEEQNQIKIIIKQKNDNQVNQVMNKLFMFYFKNYLMKDHFTFKIDSIIEYIWEKITK